MKKYVKPQYFFDGHYWMAYTDGNPKRGCAVSKQRAHDIYCKNNGMKKPCEPLLKRWLYGFNLIGS